MNKTAIKNFSIWARRKLISEITYKAGILGITDQEIAKAENPAQGIQVINLGKAGQIELTGSEITSRDKLIAKINAKAKDSNYKNAFENVVEEVAYTWFNRLIAIRFMEVNDYLPSGIRVLSSESEGKSEPDMVTIPFDTDMEFSGGEVDIIRKLKGENKLDELFRFLFIKQCKKLHEVLPDLFEETDDYTELLLTLSFTDSDGVVAHLVNDITEDDFNVEKEGQIEIIGWLYQYYNSEKKDEVFAALKKNVKISKDNIPAATQLFTPDWIVRYMVENSLGRLWYEGHPDDNIKANWKYYLDEAEQEPEVEKQLVEIRNEYAKLKPEDIKCIDPCMGSGHILVYMFDVLMQIYLSYGYTQRDAARSIVENNLYGLDIDDRAAQLAYFAVMMKGREYDSRFLTRGVKPKVFSIKESNDINKIPEKMGQTTLDTAIVDDINYVITAFKDAKEYGSILKIESRDYDRAINYIEQLKEHGADDLIMQGYINAMEKELPTIIEQAKVLSQKYDVVCTNPPYMGAGNMNGKLNEFIKDNYKDYKSDFFSAFVIRCSEFAKTTGKLGFLTPYVWMFIQSYEKMREYLYNRTIETLIQFEYSAFEEATVPICTFALSNYFINKKGCYFRLTEYKGGMEVQRQKTLEAICNHKCGYYYEQSSDNFSKIPGRPVAYWATEETINSFSNCLLGDIASTRQGFATGDNNKFLRLWHEIEYLEIGFELPSREDAVSSQKKWFPCNKGGSFRRWYGNNYFVADWYLDGSRMKAFKGSVIRNQQHYFHEGITWSSISSALLSMRYSPKGHVFESKGSMCFFNDTTNLKYVLGLMNTKVVGNMLLILAPTLDFHEGPMAKVPIVLNDDKKTVIDTYVAECITISKNDWDSFETSWDFKKHPFVCWSKGLWDDTAISCTMQHYYGEHPNVYGPLELCYMLWQGECCERFDSLKSNEEELNRIFIDIYGLQEELTPDVEDKDVSVRKADLKRDVQSFISYAVGCMFGRYSLDEEGLAFAGGEWNESKYSSFIPDEDNCIPITDEEYFEDDIVGRFIEFLKVVYGDDSLEANLDFIAKALEGKGSTSREVIRNYFLKDFFANHCKIYQKRPIYWLFDSGKQNGFKALVYMHRWNADTIGNVRIEYLHKMQNKLESEMIRMQEIIDSDGNSREIARATKRREKLVKQLEETRKYDEQIAVLALSRIDIDLDDGVKVNYEKVQVAPDGAKMDILSKIK